MGDPLSRIPALSEIPRNLALLKNMDLDIGADTAEGENETSLRLTSYDNLGLLVNRLTMVTVNGEFQPQTTTPGGWQTITLSNQSNQAFYNVRLRKQKADGSYTTLPLFIYGEDGHQYPQIRRAEGVLGTNTNSTTKLSTYTKGEDIVSVAPGKRVDVLFYLESGTTKLELVYSFIKEGVKYNVSNMGGYPDLSSSNESAQNANFSAGPLATLTVLPNTPSLTTAEQVEFVTEVNSTIPVQKILPTTKPEDYDPTKVPEVNLYAEEWKPTQGRVLNWAKDVLVGRDPNERDAPTQAAIAA